MATGSDDPKQWALHDIDQVRALLRHDARAPLHVLGLFGRLLADQPETAELGTPIVDATRELTRFFDQIENWLALGPPTPGPADLAAVLAELEAAGRLTCDGGPPAPVAMHRDHLRVALDALLPDAPVTITVSGSTPITLAGATSRSPVPPIVRRIVDAYGAELDEHPTGWRLQLPTVSD